MAIEATAVGVTTNKAGFWLRFVAIFIDGLGVGIVSNIISSLMGADAMSVGTSSINTVVGVGRGRAAGRRSACACSTSR